jgi:hypothetical protein
MRSDKGGHPGVLVVESMQGGGDVPSARITLCAGRLRSFWLRMTAQMLAVLSDSAPAGSWSG